MDAVIGCDVGSQGTKALLLSSEGRLLGEAYEPYGIDHPRPLWAEQPVERWINALAAAIPRLLAQTRFPPDQVRALSLATQVDGLVPIDARGQPLRPAMIWMDRRAAPQCEPPAKYLGAREVFRKTGLNLDASHVAPKIRWLADEQPRIFEEAAHFLLPGSYLAFYLTGELAVDYSNASSTLLMDVRTREWSPEMAGAFEVDLTRMAPLGAAAAPLGTLRESVAEQLGLGEHVTVMIGCGDEHAACLGAGLTRTGLAVDIAGTAEPVCAASTELLFDETGLIETHCHADPDQWLLENPGFVSGGNYRWLREQFAPAETYASLDAEAASVSPGAEGLTFLPSLMGAMAPTWNEAARGTYAGFTLAHTRGHFVRALLEGSAYAVRDITDQMQAVGVALHELRVVGGGARSPLWNQIKADVSGLQVSVPEITETTALGAAFLGLVGIGAYGSLSETATDLVRVRERIDPNPAAASAYVEAYARYRKTYFALLPVFEESAKSRE